MVWHRLPGQVALSAASCESFATAGAWFAAVVPPKTHFSHEAVGGKRHGNGSSGGRDKGDSTRTWQLCLLCTTEEKVVLSILLLNSQPEFRFCKMSVKPGAQYCGEHSPIPITEQDLGRLHSSRSGSLNHLILMTMHRKQAHL